MIAWGILTFATFVLLVATVDFVRPAWPEPRLIHILTITMAAAIISLVVIAGAAR